MRDKPKYGHCYEYWPDYWYGYQKTKTAFKPHEIVQVVTRPGCSAREGWRWAMNIEGWVYEIPIQELQEARQTDIDKFKAILKRKYDMFRVGMTEEKPKSKCALCALCPRRTDSLVKCAACGQMVCWKCAYLRVIDVTDALHPGGIVLCEPCDQRIGEEK